jgi:crotonobetainyl-CoA:carnitine CoA-transferase CaiB-like acyl-CoA transferase
MLGEDTFRGVRVVDLTRLLPGPFATMLLADLGAEVIKIEAPMGGDYARWTPPIVENVDGGYGAFFESVNRGKKSIGLDLKSDHGLAIAKALIATADVVIESFRPGVMERLGLGPDALAELNPNLIVCALSSFGQSGPLRLRAGHDINFLARAGALGIAGPAGSAPGLPAVQVGDLAGGALYAAFTIAAALFRRERGGGGATIDISMTEGVLSLMGPVLSIFGATGKAPARGGDTLTGGLPCYRIYETSDGGHIAVGALEPKFWAQVVSALGHPEWANDGLIMGKAADEAVARIQAAFHQKTLAEWTEVFEQLDACTEPVKSLEDVVADELFRARGAVLETGEGRLHAVPPSSRGIDVLAAKPPLLGEHTRLLAAGLSLPDGVLDSALASGAAVDRPRS